SAEQENELRQKKKVNGFGRFAFFLDSEGQAKEYLVSSTVEIDGQTYKVKPDEMNVERAMFLLFGNIEEVTKKGKVRSIWQNIHYDFFYVFGCHNVKEVTENAQNHPDGDNMQNTEETSSLEESAETIRDNNNENSEKQLTVYYAEAIHSQAFQENGLSKFVVVAGSVDEGTYMLNKESLGDDEIFGSCHACGVPISIAVFIQKNGTWRFELFNRNIGAQGSFGSPPQMSLVKIGPQKHALLLERGFTGQGITEFSYSYLWHKDGVITEHQIPIPFSDTSGYYSPDQDGYVEFDFKIEYLPNNGSEYYDIKVIFSGKRSVKVGRRYVPEPFTSFIVYRFSNETYEPIIKEGWFPEEPEDFEEDNY
ncbi:MAG: hypothetical protein ACK419_03255, partial [Pyrinomonadaceae bacterium]